jgi:hypothetical protein
VSGVEIAREIVDPNAQINGLSPFRVDPNAYLVRSAV